MAAVVVVVIIILVVIIVVKMVQASSRSANQNQYHQPSTYTPPTPPPPRPPSLRVPTPAPTSPGRTPAQVRTFLQQQLGQAYADEQERVRLQVLRQEQKVVARLARAQRIYDFEELKALHNESRQTADHAHRLMKQAEQAENDLWSRIKQTYQARDAAGARGAPRYQYTQTANALHQSKDLVRGYLVQYRTDLDRLNKNTARLRDSIRDNCGEPGRGWYRALMARTAARREGRL